MKCDCGCRLRRNNACCVLCMFVYVCVCVRRNSLFEHQKLGAQSRSCMVRIALAKSTTNILIQYSVQKLFTLNSAGRFVFQNLSFSPLKLSMTFRETKTCQVSRLWEQKQKNLTQLLNKAPLTHHEISVIFDWNDLHSNILI
jgi:hypothetical protein